MTMPAYISKLRLLISVLAFLTMPAWAGFSWGAGCEGGNGTFSVNLTTVGEVVTIGSIPLRKWNVRILLTASSDVDVQIYDANDKTKFVNDGKAIVAWCADATTCNIGALGSDEGVGYVEYKSMRVGYSGYGGIDGMPGKEWISIEGATTALLTMKAYAFETGTAIISYSFARTQTPECLGLKPFTGTFTTDVPESSVVEIGNIPRGKKDLQVNLYCEKDVDIQLYDIEDTSKFAGGKAIIGYCDTAGCNKGFLGNNDGTQEDTIYKNRNYEYSGYDGDGRSKGNEYIRLSGVSNTELSMKAYGYAAGNAIVTYSYYEDYDLAGPVQPTVDFLYAVNRRDCFTSMFKNVPSDLLLVRRDAAFQFVVNSPEHGILHDNVRVYISGWVGEEYRFGLPERGSPSEMPQPNQMMVQIDNYVVETVQDGATRVAVRVLLDRSAPIGWYQLSVFIDVEDTADNSRSEKTIIKYSCNTTMIILFNSYGKKDDVKQTKSNRDEYVENEKGLIWQGLSDDNTAHVWGFDQFEFDNLRLSLDCVRRMTLSERGDAALVSRHLTYAIGQDICYGKWGEGSYTSGKPPGGYKCSVSGTKTCFEPGYWTGTTELFKVHRQIHGKPVQYCQCFVYSGVLTTIGRSLGIPTRTVTTFQSAHDTNADRSISKFYIIDNSTGIFTPTNIPDGYGHDSIWSFHVWNEMYFKRPILNEQLECKNCANGWQAVDATPQEISFGGDSSLPTYGAYMMGPASLKMIKHNRDPVCRNQTSKYGCFDSQFVVSETNANILMYTKDFQSGVLNSNNFELYPKNCGDIVSCGFSTDPFGDNFATVGLQISTKKKGEISPSCLKGSDDDEARDCSRDLDDITSKYKDREPSGPGKPTSIENRRQLRRILNDKALNLTRYNISVGVAPTASGPVINEPGHPASSVLIAVTPFQGPDNNVSVPRLRCALVVTVRDYTSKIISNIYKESMISENGINDCIFQEIKRSQWLEFATTHFDVGKNNITSAMEPSERAYALHFAITASTSDDGIILMEERTKIICTPRIGSGSLRSKILCDDNRGQWIRPESDSNSQSYLAHLDKSVRSPGCQNAGVTKPWASRGGPDDGICQQSNNVDGCWDGGDCCTYSCFQLNGEFKQLSSDGKTWEFSHRCFELNDTIDCTDSIFKRENFSSTMKRNLLDYSRPVPAAYIPDDGKDLDQCLKAVQIIGDYILEKKGASNFCNLFASYICSNESFARTRVECATEISQIIPNNCNGGKLPRCKARTKKNCQCKEEWSFVNHQSTTFLFQNHDCGNPYLAGGYNYHQNNWCNIVAGSCLDTVSGNPGGASYYDSTQNPPSWWDDCGTGAADTATGSLLPAGHGAMRWTAENLRSAFPISYAGVDNNSVFMRVDGTVTVPINIMVTTTTPAQTTTKPSKHSMATLNNPNLDSWIVIISAIVFFGIILYVLHRCCKHKAEKGGHQKTTKSYELQKKSIGIVI